MRLTALVDDVSIGGRPGATYGGFNLRTFPEFDQRKIDMHIEPPEAKPRRAWFHLTGKFPGGKGLAGVAMFEHVTNPDYPSFPNPQNADRVPGEYPRWRSVQPAWPGDREVALPSRRADRAQLSALDSPRSQRRGHVGSGLGVVCVPAGSAMAGVENE